MTASVGQSGNPARAAAEYNPGGVLPEVSETPWFLFPGTLLGLVFLLFVPALVGLLSRRKPLPPKSRIRLK